MTVLKIRNDYSFLETADDRLKITLWNALRFRQRGYFHSSQYKQKKWDGYVNFFDKVTGKFLSGLLPEVHLALHHLKVPYETADERPAPVVFTRSAVTDQFLNEGRHEGVGPVTLEDYQVDFVNMALTHHRGIIKAPTSAGKTFVMLGILKCLPPGTPTLFLANRKTLVQQNYEEMIKWGLPNVGRFYDKYLEPNLITCATIQSLHKLGNLLPKIRALVVDEIHMLMGPQAIKVYKKMTGASVRIAVSATPFKFEYRGKNKKMVGGDDVHKYNVKGYFGGEFLTSTTESGKLTTAHLQQRGRLSASECTFYTITEPQIPHDTYIDAVTNGIAQSWAFHKIVSRLAKTLTGRTLILVERLQHGDALHGLLPGSLWVQGKDTIDTRKHVIDQLSAAKGNVIGIATSGIFNTGVNVRSHNLVNAAGGKASHEIIQRMGRGLRTADDKEILNYYDFYFRINDYLQSHSEHRIKILSDEGHQVIVKEELDF